MERPTFFRPADDLDFMAPLSDFSDDETITAPSTARSMALAAKKRGLLAKPKATPEPTQSQRGRQLWADITTDDEDNFPAWRPSRTAIPAASTKQMESEAKSNGLVWDPIGLGTSESIVTDLLYHKTGAKVTPGTGTVFDKWSWSTTATESVDSTESPAEDLQTDDEDPTPKAAHTVSLQELQAPQMPQQPAAVQQFAAFQQMQPAQPMHQPMQQPMTRPMQQPMQAQPLLQTPPMTMLPMQMQQDVVHPTHPTQPGMVFAVPCNMSMGMGMLPMVMSTMGRQPAQAVQSAQGRVQPAAQAQSPWEKTVANTPGPVMGKAHRFHQKNSSMGVLSSDARTFTKKQNKGRLSIVSENKVHFQGTVHYALQFTEGELCSADGVGFILSSDLPCTRNIQKIISVFANRTGRICIRVHDEVVRCSQRVKELDVGDWLEVKADLANQSVSFTVWPQDNSSPSFATVSFKEVLENARGRVNGVPRNPCGFLAVVIKHVGVSVQLGS